MNTRGRCWKFGDNIPTDQIVRSDRVFLPVEEIAKYVLDNLNPAFAKNVQPGDVLVAGKHFGQSSGRAIAPKAIKATKVGAVVVEYAARLFYRNCFEIGLPLLECPGITKEVNDGDILFVDVAAGLIRNETTGKEFRAKSIAPFLMNMLEVGGLIPMANQLVHQD